MVYGLLTDFLIFGQAVLEGVFNEAGNVFYLEFADEVFAVGFYGVKADEEFIGYFVGGEFLGN